MMSGNKKKLRIVAILFVLVFSTVLGVSKIQVRTVDFLSILALGMALGVLLSTLLSNRKS